MPPPFYDQLNNAKRLAKQKASRFFIFFRFTPPSILISTILQVTGHISPNKVLHHFVRPSLLGRFDYINDTLLIAAMSAD